MSEADEARAHVGEVAARFAGGAAAARVVPLGSGHIHATFHVARGDPSRDLVLQRLNEHVFPDLDAVMDNLALVCGHLRRHTSDPRRALELVTTGEGERLVRDADGAAWRAFRYIAGTRSYDVVPDDGVARAAARAFGAFAAALGDLDASRLALPIPGFHDLSARLEQLRVAASDDAVGRLAEVRSDRDAILELGRRVVASLEEGGLAELPVRVVHNDCKVNNLLFDATTGEPLCVVDLDTVMPGPLLVDFGELVRTGACDAPEDEVDLSRVVFSAQRFDALARGYLEGLGGTVASAERALLWAGPPWMALENAARFLADHLAGDRYFRSGDNRARARAQRRLAEQLWEARDALREAIDRAARGGDGGPERRGPG
jgi:N-acetylhexosamine 1-kinase